MNRKRWLYVIAFGAGAATWAVIAAATGRREAWDGAAYFSLGIPLLCLVSAGLAWLEPRRWWAFGLLPYAGQFAWTLLAQGPGNLWPLSIIAFGVMSVPSLLAAGVAARVASNRQA